MSLKAVGRYYKQFNESEKYGKDAEKRVAGIMEGAGWAVGKFEITNKHDFYISYAGGDRGGRGTRVEVKCEDNWTQSGNLCLETQQYHDGRKSGLMVSVAEVVVHTLQDYCCAFRRVEMKEYLAGRIADGTMKIRPIGQKEVMAMGYLMPIEDCVDFDWFEHIEMARLGGSAIWGIDG